MIQTVAQFLDEFLELQKPLLDEEAVKHGPSIGDMYEGLTREVLGKVIPPVFEVQIIDGFIEGHDGRLSPQIDAMLVAGSAGRRMPHTAHYVWPIADVLATFEVKKTLYADQLADGMSKSATIWHMQQECFRHGSLKGKDIGASVRGFARFSGKQPANDMPEEDREILNAIIAEQYCPVRVIFGYQGYANEHGLRSAFLDQVGTWVGSEASGGPVGFPNLVICGQNSLLKLSGHPYIAAQQDKYWQFIGSERAQPLRMLIELIWTRLSNRFETILPMDDALEEEQIVGLLLAKSVVEDGKRGWYYKALEPSKDFLDERGPAAQWKPIELTQAEYTLFMIANHEGGMDLASGSLTNYANEKGWDLAAVAESLVRSRLMAWTTPTLAMPITETTGLIITPDGKFWGSSNAELLGLWVGKYQADRGR